MPDLIYYAYFLGEDGAIKNRVDISCDDDTEAKHLAQQLVDLEGQAVELWQRDRKVRVIERLSAGP